MWATFVCLCYLNSKVVRIGSCMENAHGSHTSAFSLGVFLCGNLDLSSSYFINLLCYSVSVQLFTWQAPTCCAEDPVLRASLLCLNPSRNPVSRVGVSLNQIRGKQIEMHDVSSATPVRDKPPHPREGQKCPVGRGVPPRPRPSQP